MAYIGQKPGSNFRNVTLKDSFTGDGSTTAFDLSKSFNQAGQNDLEVFVDNVRQEPTAAYTVGQDDSGNFKRVTFTAAPASGATIYILNQGETSGVLTVSEGAVTSAKIGNGAVTSAKIGNDAVSDEHLDVTAITGHTELAEAPADTDTFLVHDASAGALKKIQNSNLVGSALITGKDALTVPTTDDLLLIYDASTLSLKKVSRSDLVGAPNITSVSPTNATSGDGTGNYTFVITGTAFSGATAVLLTSGGSEVSFDTLTIDSSTQITGVIAKSSLSNANEPYGVKVTGASNISDTLTSQINIDAQPVFSTAAGSLATVTDSGRASFSAITVAAADPESGGDVTYTLESGSLPAGLSGSSTSSGYVISGTPSGVGSNTTSNFTIRAKDVNSNTSDRAFSITINAPVIQSFTSSGTFSVPSGTTSVDVLVVAGGGAGGTWHGGGGGAGGLIYRPGFPVTPGGTVSVTVGCGAGIVSAPAAGQPGQDSVFGTLTAKGGGGGGRWTENTGQPGGSAGGNSAGPGSPGTTGTATQPTQPGDSGTYGFGNTGGTGEPAPGNGGGGGGAGAAGTPGNGCNGGCGGIGKAYTIADGTTSVYYAGGGGAGDHERPCRGAGGQGGGGDGAYQQTGPGNAQPGTANRGGGGGGTGACGQGGGGKGIVIVSY